MTHPDERRRHTLVHEVKNVLTAIKTEAQVNGRENKLRPDLMLFIVDRVNKAVKLLDEFLDVGKEH